MKELFQLDPALAYLNHGAFGACPREVFEIYQEYERELERQPTAFLQREYPDRMQSAREALASYLHADKDDLAFVANATFGLNAIAASLVLHPGDEVLTNNHEYGATARMWESVCRRQGASLRAVSLPHRADSSRQISDGLVESISPRTRVVFLSHITSPTAMRMPIEDVIAACRSRGVICIVDGAHGPGQIDLDLGKLDADVYVGNCHKWLMAPKSAGFIHVRRNLHDMMAPLVVSWGRQSHSPTDFVREMEYQGTFGIASFLVVADCVEFLESHDWPSVRERCRELRDRLERRVRELTGLASLYGEDSLTCPQMVTMELPSGVDVNHLKQALLDQFLVEIPVQELEGRKYMRASLQAYNGDSDLDRLVGGLGELLPRRGS